MSNKPSDPEIIDAILDEVPELRQLVSRMDPDRMDTYMRAAKFTAEMRHFRAHVSPIEYARSRYK